MTNKELFKQAVNEGFVIRMERDTALIGKEIVCSEGHYRKLSEIFGFEVKNPNIKRKTIRRTVAAILIAAALLLAGCTAVVYKEKIEDFFTTAFDTYIKGYFVSEDAENKEIIEEYYTLTYVPEGYELVEEKHKVEVAISIWETQDGNQLIFEQSTLNAGRYFIDNESGQSDVIETEEYTVYFRNVDGTYRCIWSNEKFAFYLFFEKELSTEEIIKIIEGINPKQK